jgi:hypothetical protein
VYVGHHIFNRRLRYELPAFHRDHRAIALEVITELSSDAVGPLIDRGELDAAVFTAPAWSLPRHAEVVRDIPCAVAASRELVGDGPLSPHEVAGLPFVLPVESAPAARWIEAELHKLEIAPRNIVARTPFLDVKQKMVEDGAAAAFLFCEDIDGSAVRDGLRRLTREVHGFQRVLVVRPNERRPEVLAVTDFLRRIIKGSIAPSLA